ncbi:MAG: hypothetical protein KF805_16905 [Phycisphaeraceae bacterium]|nr:hypothetical protein [Phycisphaeraceae bacterium]
MEQPVLANRSIRQGPLVAMAVVFVLVAGAIALRATMLFSKILPPGVDAAYYPLQSRGVLEDGKLPYVDVPLIFWLDAALAKLFIAVRGMDVDSATLLASRVVDAVSQPLAAIPLALLMFGFVGALQGCRTARTGDDAKQDAAGSRWFFAVVVTAFVVGAIAILSPPILRMTGDFQKNSLGLVWMAASAWATYLALRSGTLVRWVLPAIFLSLAAITHIGAFSVTLVLVGSTVAVFVVQKRRFGPRTIAITGVACVIGAGVLWLLVYTVAPSKAIGLAQGVTKMFTVGDRPQGRPAIAGGQAQQNPPRDGPEFDRPARHGGPTDRPENRQRDRQANPQGNRPQGPPGGFPESAMSLRAAAWAVLLAFGGLAIWRARRVGAPELAIVAGAVCTAALITCPLIQGQYAERLSLMTPIPLAIIVGFLLLSCAESARRWVRIGVPTVGALAGIAILVAAFPMAMRGKGGPPPRFANNGTDSSRRQGPGPDGGVPGGGGGGSIVADEAAPEFRSMRGLVPTDGSAVVIARHGLQWWAGYFLKTPVREEHATKEQLEKYDRVFVLTEKRSGRIGPGGGPGSGWGPDDGPVGDQGGPRRPPDGGSMIRVPANAEIVYDGEFYKLVLLPASETR